MIDGVRILPQRNPAQPQVFISKEEDGRGFISFSAG
jgi:hypothetical protein